MATTPSVLTRQTIAETDSAGSTSNAYYHEYVFFAGRRVARSDPSSGSVYYFFVDQVGSTRIVTQANGTVCFNQDYFPYGQEINTGTQSCPQSYKFTGYERDWETGLDYAFARYYNPRLARFMSVDPLAGDVGDPQSLNRYAYVWNNPMNFTDPTGMYGCGTCPPPPPPPPPIGPVYTGGGGGSPITDSEDCVGGCKPAWKDQKPPKPRETKGVGQVLSCAADFGSKYSIAGLLHGLGVPNGGVAGFVTDALGGNAFSGLTNVILSAKNGAAGGHGFAYNSAQSHLQGPTQGIVPPGTVRGPWAASPASAATGAIVRGAFSLANTSQTLTMLSGEVSLASTSLTAAEFASGFAAVKFGYDAFSFVTGLAVCAAK